MIVTESGESESQKAIFAMFQSIGKREHQEDCFGQVKGECFMIADGIGGGPNGEVAARIAVEQACLTYKVLHIRLFYHEAKGHLVGQVFKNALRAVSREQKNYPGMGTTLVGGCVGVKGVWIGNSGDSRAYLLHEGMLKQITTDHEDSEGRITQWAGKEKAVFDQFDNPFVRGDILLLTTDGLFLGLTDLEIQKILLTSGNTKESLEKTARTLVEESLKKDGRDNITVCLVRKM